MAEQETTEVQQTPEAQAAAPAPVDLTVNDLLSIRSIIDVASQRGAFKAPELEAVGKTFNKLNSFLEAVTKKEE